LTISCSASPWRRKLLTTMSPASEATALRRPLSNCRSALALERRDVYTRGIGVSGDARDDADHAELRVERQRKLRCVLQRPRGGGRSVDGDEDVPVHRGDLSAGRATLCAAHGRVGAGCRSNSAVSRDRRVGRGRRGRLRDLPRQPERTAALASWLDFYSHR
jgi:hypothetical protein